MIIDTHAHLYLDSFATDIDLVVDRAKKVGVMEVFLPNINSETIDSVFDLCDRYPDFFRPMLGLHPVYVKEDYKKQLAAIEERLDERPLAAIGEIGTDAHWDQRFLAEQKEAFDVQCSWAIERDLPIVIHARESMEMQIDMVHKYNGRLKGIFHCFTGTEEQARAITAMNFFLGIGGVLTYKNSTLHQVLPGVGLDRLVLETDAPYLSPIPKRGKRNESSYLPFIVEKLSDVFSVSGKEVERITSDNAREIFN